MCDSVCVSCFNNSSGGGGGGGGTWLFVGELLHWRKA